MFATIHIESGQIFCKMSEGKLLIKDSRTQREYEIPIIKNAVAATAFKQIKGPELDQSRQDKGSSSLKIYDPGLANTATLESDLLFMYVSLA